MPLVVAELLKIREQNGASTAYLGQLRTTLNRFATRFPGPILEVTGPDVDAWLRGLDVTTVTRNSRLRCIKVLFSFAKAHNYLPKEKTTAEQEETTQSPIKLELQTSSKCAAMRDFQHKWTSRRKGTMGLPTGANGSGSGSGTCRFVRHRSKIPHI